MRKQGVFRLSVVARGVGGAACHGEDGGRRDGVTDSASDPTELRGDVPVLSVSLLLCACLGYV